MSCFIYCLCSSIVTVFVRIKKIVVHFAVTNIRYVRKIYIHLQLCANEQTRGFESTGLLCSGKTLQQQKARSTLTLWLQLCLPFLLFFFFFFFYIYKNICFCKAHACSHKHIFSAAGTPFAIKTFRSCSCRTLWWRPPVTVKCTSYWSNNLLGQFIVICIF